LFGAASAICFTRGRVKFVSPKGEFAAPAMGQAFTYFGKRPERFAQVFSEVGNVVSVVAKAIPKHAANDNRPRLAKAA
jgi:hypothetical protein